MEELLEFEEVLREVKELNESVEGILKECKVKRELKEKKKCDLEDITKELEIKEKELELYIKASRLLGEVSDETTKLTLDKITTVINKALGVLFKGEDIKVEIKQEVYRKIYPHYKVYLKIGGREMTFKQNGTGLAQVVSFLFTVSLIDIKGGRKLIVMDELLSGLHPEAKYIIKGLIESLSGRFQFVLVEYGLDVGKQYEVKRVKGGSILEEYKTGNYYKEIELGV